MDLTRPEVSTAKPAATSASAPRAAPGSRPTSPGAVRNPEEVWQLTDEMLVAQGRWLLQLHEAIPAARARLLAREKAGTRVKLRPRWRGAARLKTKSVHELARDVAAADKGRMTLDHHIARRGYLNRKEFRPSRAVRVAWSARMRLTGTLHQDRFTSCRFAPISRQRKRGPSPSTLSLRSSAATGFVAVDRFSPRRPARIRPSHHARCAESDGLAQIFRAPAGILTSSPHPACCSARSRPHRRG